MRPVSLMLLRDVRDELRIFGAIYHGQLVVCQTLERVDNHAAPGSYELVPHGWGDDPHAAARTKKDCWALVGPGISHDPEPGVPHAAMLIHAGNVLADSEGCTLPGLLRGKLEGEPAVLRSQQAMARLREIIGPNRARYTIMERG